MRICKKQDFHYFHCPKYRSDRSIFEDSIFLNSKMKHCFPVDIIDFWDIDLLQTSLTKQIKTIRYKQKLLGINKFRCKI